jgi:hypothetical protein
LKIFGLKEKEEIKLLGIHNVAANLILSSRIIVTDEYFSIKYGYSVRILR